MHQSSPAPTMLRSEDGGKLVGLPQKSFNGSNPLTAFCVFRNLWNFSPKHFFTDPSGMYWRERRLRPGLYTDGLSVYESSYRYSDGRNGMRRVSGFQQFIASKSVKGEQKQQILKKLKEAEPDVVLEL